MKFQLRGKDQIIIAYAFFKTKSQWHGIQHFLNKACGLLLELETPDVLRYNRINNQL